MAQRQNWRGLLNTWVQTHPGRVTGSPEFSMVSEEGQAHNKVFKFQCKVTLDTVEKLAQGQGQSKKVAKAMAAKAMYAVFTGVPVESLQDNAVAPTPAPQPATTAAAGEKPAHVPDQSKNYIGQLHEFVQTHQDLKPERPVFEPVIDPTQPAGSPFVMKATMKLGDEEKTATGEGRKKKAAKQNAAKNLLALLPFDPNRKKRKKAFGARGGNSKKQRHAGIGFNANGQNAMGAMGIHSDLAQKAEAAYKEYTNAVSTGDDADELYSKYRDIYQEYANEYAKTYRAQIAPESRAKMNQKGDAPRQGPAATEGAKPEAAA